MTRDPPVEHQAEAGDARARPSDVPSEGAGHGFTLIRSRMVEEGTVNGFSLPDWEEVSSTLEPARFLDALDARLGGLEPCRDRRLNARRFFAVLDRQANAVLLGGLVARGEMNREDADQRRLTMGLLGNELRARVRRRCNGLTGSRDHCRASRSCDRHASRLQLVSRLFLDLVVEYFGGSIPAFEQAFEWFANGELRLTLPIQVVSTQPSSANFFLFGEFALMAHDHGLEPEAWSRLGRVMVRAQRIFARVYAPADRSAATFSSYQARDYARHGRPFTPRELARLREPPATDLAIEAARNAIESMPGIAAGERSATETSLEAGM